MKRCYQCDIIKEENEFYKNKKRSDGLQSICKSCSLIRRKEYYQKNKVKENLRNKAKQKELQDFVKEYKENLGCAVCKEKRWYVLQFHHKDKEEKEAEISSLVRYGNLNRLKKEMKKCIVLCSNCHIELHYKNKDQWS